MRTSILIALLLAAGSLRTPLLAQESDDEWLQRCQSEDWNDDDRERVCTVREVGFRPGGGTIQIDAGQNGGISILGWDRDSVAVSARIQVHARTTERAREMERAIVIHAGRDAIRADRSGGASGGWSVSFVIHVPRRSPLRAETHNGPIAVREVSGEMVLRAQNGPMTLRSVGGDVRARTTNGPLTVDLAGSRWDGAGLDAETQNGPVRLTIPEGYSARLETGTVNGPMRIDFPMTIQGRIDRRFTTTLGQGGPPVRVITTNGPLVIRRG